MNKILIVEKESGPIKESLERLAKDGFEMYCAHDGHAGLQIAKDKVPDLIITDAIIPGLSGYELCKAIKHDDETKSIPIVVMTEKHQMEDSFMFLGVKNFVNKPVSAGQLETVVKDVLNMSQKLDLQKSRILIHGRPEVISCCQQLLKNEAHWIGHFCNQSDTFIENAIKYSPDVIMLDLLAPGDPADELIKKIKLVAELKNTVMLTYYSTASVSQDHITVQAQMIEVQYMKMLCQEAGAREYLGPFNPVTFLNLINIYRKDFEP